MLKNILYNIDVKFEFYVAAFITLAGIGVATLGWFPGQIIIEIITLLTVQSLCIMLAHTSPVHLETNKSN